MNRQPIRLALLVLALGVPGARAEERPRLRPSGIDGALVICGGAAPEAARDEFVRLAGGDKAKLVVVVAGGGAEKLLEAWTARKPASAVLLKVPSKNADEGAPDPGPLRQATGAWLAPGVRPNPALEKELAALLARGGAVGTEEVNEGDGFDLLPGAAIARHSANDRTKRLMRVLERNRGHVGLGIDEGAALVVSGRDLRVLGEGAVHVCLAAGPARPARTVELRAGRHSDWTMWRRAAAARAGAAFPAAEAAVPEVPAGALVIVGGGGMPPPVMRKFLELAGGAEAPLVVLPTAQPDPIPPRYYEATLFERAGAKNVHVLPGRDRKDVENPKNLDLLRKAGGVWFGGGRQWRFVDAYEGTKAEPLLRDVLRRGGVIGGSSAGASVQAEYMVRGSPLNNTDMMCEGYERGLGFLPGTAIDQHFSRRNRFADMTALMRTYPQLLGIGIDEATALVVRGHVGEVVGRGKVHFYDRRKPVPENGPDYEAVADGGRYDLKARKVLEAGGTK